MKQRRLLVATAAVLPLAWGFTGCQDGSFAMHYHDNRPPPEPRVHVHHVCTASCNHYYDGDRVVVIRERHVHGPGCGHHFDGRRWVLVVVRPEPRPVVIHRDHDPHVHPAPPPRKIVVRDHDHHHGPHCGCVYDRRGSKWVDVQRGHVHGPRCGHVYVEGRWSTR